MYQWNYGVFSSTASSLLATHLKIAAGKVGLNLNVFGPNPVAHHVGNKFIRVAGKDYNKTSNLCIITEDQSIILELEFYVVWPVLTWQVY